MDASAAKRFKILNLPEWVKMTLISIALFIVLFALYIAVKPLYAQSTPKGEFSKTGAAAQTLIFIAVLCVAAIGTVLFIRKKLTVKTALILIFIIALLVRIGYMLVTAPNSRQYDTFVSGGNGHAGYAYYIYENAALPDNNGYQFYHPPLNALLQALFMCVTNGLTNAISSLFGMGDYFLTAFNEGKPEWLTSARYYLYGTCQILSMMYSFFTLIVGYKILKTVGLKEKTLAFWFAFFAFFPRHIMFAATLNNDPLAYLNTLLAVLFALRWWLNGKRMRDIIFCAVFIALGVNTKISVAVVCLPIGLVFLYEFIKSLIKKDDALPIGKLILQYVVFIAICAPISLLFIVYAKIRFDQDIGFVFSNLNRMLSTAHHSLFERFFVTFDKNEYFYSFYLRTFTNASTGVYNNYNVYNFAVRSAIFGEFGFWRGESFAVTALLTLISLTVVFFCAVVIVVVCFIKRKKAEKVPFDLFTADVDTKRFLFGAALFISQFASYIYFNLKMPYSCTMDFRYVMPLIISVPLMLSGFGKYTENNKGLKIYKAIMDINIVLFLTASTLFYMTCI